MAIRDLDPQGSSSLTSKFKDFQGQGQPILKFLNSSQGLNSSKNLRSFQGETLNNLENRGKDENEISRDSKNESRVEQCKNSRNF